jgi:hypothetical protein
MEAGFTRLNGLIDSLASLCAREFVSISEDFTQVHKRLDDIDGKIEAFAHRVDFEAEERLSAGEARFCRCRRRQEAAELAGSHGSRRLNGAGTPRRSGAKIRLWYKGTMTRDQFKEILNRVLSWPPDDQEKVARFVREVEQRRADDDIGEEEWEIIEARAARRDLATDKEVEQVFSRYRRA